MFGCDSAAMALRLALEAREALARRPDGVGSTLMATSRSELRVAGAVDLAHATRSEGRDDDVRAEPAAAGEGQGTAILTSF